MSELTTSADCPSAVTATSRGAPPSDSVVALGAPAAGTSPITSDPLNCPPPASTSSPEGTMAAPPSHRSGLNPTASGASKVRSTSTKP